MYSYTVDNYLLYFIHSIFIALYVYTFQERSQRAELESELHSKSISEKAVSELEEMMRDIRTERDMLKRANDRLMKG